MDGTVPSNLYMILVSFAAGMGGLLFGYEIGVTGQLWFMDSFLEFVKIDFDAGKEQENFKQGLITFIFLLGCSIGAIIVSYMADIVGRKRSIMIAGAVFFFGALVQSIAISNAMLFFGRLVSGISTGVLSMASPLYISEIAKKENRGRILTIFQLMITIGILLARIVEVIIVKLVPVPNDKNDPKKDLQWRISMAVQMVPAILLLMATYNIPLSPRWLAEKGRNQECLDVLVKLRNTHHQDKKLQCEFNEIISVQQSSDEGSWKELISGRYSDNMIRAIIIQFFQQWTGINVIFYYQSNLLKGMGLWAESSTTLLTLSNGFVNIIATLPAIYFIDICGRRKLLIAGGVGMGVAHFLVALFSKLGDAGYQKFYFEAIASVYMFIICFACTWGPIAWIYQSEVFPQKIRAKGAGVATLSNWTTNALIAYITPKFEEVMGSSMYFIFGVSGLIMAGFAFVAIPETMGIPLEEMDSLFK